MKLFYKILAQNGSKIGYDKREGGIRMEWYIILVGAVIFLCIGACSISSRLGIPTLLLFIVLGMLFGSEGIGGIEFENYNFANYVCSTGLIYIMFYGGFGTNWKMAKPVAIKAGILSTLGVVLSALFTGIFCYYVLHIPMLESLLLGSVIGSTDAAAVFYILRAKKLNLKNGLASLLEIESGSNDPIANLMTIILLSVIQNGSATGSGILLIKQIVIGVALGVFWGMVIAYILRKVESIGDGLDTILVFATALFAYGLTNKLGGNGYLAAYITGIILGNSKIPNKVTMVHFFDSMTSLVQMLVFFILGLLSYPTQVAQYLPDAIAVMLFLTLIARPMAVAILMTPFKVPIRDQIFISWAGLRGASAIVFAIVVTVSNVYNENKIFNIVFCVAMLSVGIQGTLLPFVAKKLRLIDNDSPVSMTFNDYKNDADVKLMNIFISENHPWEGVAIRDIKFPYHSLVVLIKRGEEIVIPKGATILKRADIVVLSSETEDEPDDLDLREITIPKNHIWANKKIAECKMPKETIIIMLKRKEGNIVPNGETIIKENDILLTCSLK